eukprot:SAG31_NODE_412_length_15972_cov_3.590626_6_plen_101_part_00
MACASVSADCPDARLGKLWLCRYCCRHVDICFYSRIALHSCCVLQRCLWNLRAALSLSLICTHPNLFLTIRTPEKGFRRFHYFALPPGNLFCPVQHIRSL